ncbi:MAG: flavin reductase family protein [Candidatus Melainabacteria bacterium]
MSPGFVDVDFLSLPRPDRYKLLIGSVVPRPIAWVSTCDAQGNLNLAPFSYFNAVCTEPPTVLFCPNIRSTDGEKKDTLKNIEATGEFVINIVTEDTVVAANQSAADYAYGVSEFEQAGVTPLASLAVRPPRVAESPIQMECRLQQVIPVGDGSIGSGFIVLGTVVQYHAREDVYADGKILIEKLKPVSRLAGNSYAPVRDVFELPRPVL